MDGNQQTAEEPKFLSGSCLIIVFIVLAMGIGGCFLLGCLIGVVVMVWQKVENHNKCIQKNVEQGLQPGRYGSYQHPKNHFYRRSFPVL